MKWIRVGFRLSLSVEVGNPAAELYRAFGFRATGRSGGSDTMTLEVERYA